jgi:hypothetical protein
MGSCLRARGRKALRSLFLKLFSLGFAFIVIFVSLKRYRAADPVTTKQSWDLLVPLSRED